MRLRIVLMLSLLLLIIPVVHAKEGECPVTTPTSDLPPEAEIASWSNRWYRSEDGELWADAGRRYADGVKVGWRKPLGAVLEVSGRRLDGDAPPLETEINSEAYSGHFQASGLIFPTGGCWEISAHAENSTLTFVNYVYPKAYAPPGLGNTCDSIPALVDASAFVLLGTPEGDYPVPGGDYGFETVRAERVLKGGLRSGERLEVLRDLTYDTPLERGSEYLLFLLARPGYDLMAICPLARVEGDHITVPYEWGALKDGLRVDDLIEEIQAAR